MSGSLEAEIRALPDIFSFYRWLALKIDVARLPLQPIPTIKDKQPVYHFTPEAENTVTQFCDWARSVYNVTHVTDPFTPLDLADTLAEIDQIWRNDEQRLQKMRLIPK